MTGRQQEFWKRSIENRNEFWTDQAALVDWHQPFDCVLDYSNPPFAKWFCGGELNLCHNAVDRHLPQRANQAALVYVSTETDAERTFSYSELHREVQRVAAVLQ